MVPHQSFELTMLPPSNAARKSASRRSRPKMAVWRLAADVMAAALFSAFPAALEILEYARYRDAPGVPFVGRWALLILLAAILQFSYGVLLIQVPDWSAVWVATLSLLG